MVIAFIPVRGGSKSIPLKNIKPFCDKPLVFWNISALQQTVAVDRIVVATDSDEIERVVMAFRFDKVEIFRRSEENASDTASTESVMLEYIQYAKLNPNITFILAQATSPLTESTHFAEALEIYKTGDYDSMLTCVRNKRFFWSALGESLNYDYHHRPRRQEFEGVLMENGAFYISTVGNILEARNRLSGRIGIYEMPEYTATEIDEPEDWIVLESLKRRYTHTIPKYLLPKLFLSDVDGTLTDGGMYYSELGDELKKFNTRDGAGFAILRNRGIYTGFVTSENTRLVEKRAQKLKIDYLVQGEREGGKLTAVKRICEELNITLDEVAYIGDDMNCHNLLSEVGFRACPANACETVRDIPGIYVMKHKGGEGCVREFIELLIHNAND
ncbi:MAG: acylneuraminate cytidylyltransferase [Bacteroidales bacterium]|nr:acylneuraminate cytidylyltransferase [Bacteroidales bacterium]